ncbi:MAG: dienelactone hydrolase family protein [Zoogloeaceae bacterium]|nr:dienelactone hydrolase family protein [Zoogloeaceae bacterium]MCK6382791.1 dienelactone hydrolase family protein [Rhodocyclaceae bacterium]
MKSAWWKVVVFFTSLSWSVSGSAQGFNRESVSFESLPGKDGKPPAVITADLYTLAEQPVPWPAVILVHGSGGVSEHREHWYAKEFIARGFAALIIDSFKPRGVVSTVEDQSKVTQAMMNRDAFAALRFLSSDRRIDSKRIGVMGFSKGGNVALYAAMTTLASFTDTLGNPGLRFAFHIPFYPGCNHQLRNPDTTGRPVLMMLGELDDYTPPGPCIEYAKRLQAAGAKLEYQVVSGAHHGWETETGPHYLPRGERLKGCEYLIEDDWRLTWVKNNDGKSVAPLTLSGQEYARHYESECKQYGPTVGGGNPEMKRKALGVVFGFLERHGLRRP